MSKTTQEWMTFENLCSDTEGREAVAEVVRLREDLEALRDYYIDREVRSRERLESATDEREQIQFARFAHMHRRAHEALTRILEGGTDG